MTHTELVIDYLRRHRGDVVTNGDIHQALEIPRKRVSKIMSSLAATWGDALERRAPGQWLYEPARRPVGGPDDPGPVATYRAPYAELDDLAVPVGWRFTATVVARMTIAERVARYVIRTKSGLMLFADPIFAAEAADGLLLDAAE